ncbi:ATP-binding protein [bacterium]|nr:ATP-binding protein [bacterium]
MKNKNENKIEKIDITPDRSIYHKIGEANYSIGDAIAELVDNSIDASNDNGVEIFIILDKKKNEIIVEDNGKGMNKETASKSLILAHSKKESALGEFGLGMKSACTSLGNEFEIETTSINSEEKFILKYNKNEFLKIEGWKNYPLHILKESNKSHGTKIRIQSLKIKLYDALVTRLKNDLSLRYSPYIEHNDVVIKIGLRKDTAKPCKPNRPKLVENNKTEFDFRLSNGENISGWYGLLEVGNQKGSGFNMFRRSRLIRSAEKLGYNYHPSKMHITGNINLDGVPVTHNKREFIIESGEFREFIKKFWGDQTEKYTGERVRGLIDKITKLATERSSKQKADNSMPIEKKETIKNKVLEALNRVDDFRELAFPESLQGKRSKNGDPAEIEKRNKPQKIAQEEIITEQEQTRDKRTPQKIQTRKEKFIMVAGKRFKFDFYLQNLDNNRLDKETIINDNNVIDIYINTGFKGYILTKDTDYYATFHISEAIAEIYVKEAKQNTERIFELRNSLIHEVAAVILEEEELHKIEKDEQELLNKVAKKKELLKRKEETSL